MKLREFDIDNTWLQKDRAKLHTAYVTIELLRQKLGDSIILGNRNIQEPRRNCDLIISKNKPDFLQDLQVNIDVTFMIYVLIVEEKCLKIGFINLVVDAI